MQTLQIEGQTAYFGTSEDMSVIPDACVDFIITSPPYWNLKDYGDEAQIGHEPYEKYLERLNAVWRECYRVAKPDTIMVVNINSRRANKRFYPIAFDIYRTISLWQLWDVMIWYIPNALPQPNHYMNRLFDNKFEYLLVFLKGDPDRYKFHKPRVPQKYAGVDPRDYKLNEQGRCLGNVIRIPAYRPPNIKQQNYHVAAYPEELVALMLATYTDEGDLVLDPFLGSGTTLKVARVMNRRGIGFEVNTRYAELIRERICEPWKVPDWSDLDILHASTMVPGMLKPRKAHFQTARLAQLPLISDPQPPTLFSLEEQETP
jgi:DNA modification methylase